MNDADKEDWRLEGVATVLDVPPNTQIKARRGDALKVCIPIKSGKSTTAVGLPNASALYLDFSMRLFKQAMDAHKEAFRKTSKEYVPDKLFLSFYQKMFGSIVFAFCAIETFANYEIPDDHMHYRRWRKLYIARAKSTIERWESLDAKLGEILPEVLNVPSPKGTSTWEVYLRLKDLRDRIVHLKTEERRALMTNPNSLWIQLCTSSPECYPQTAKRIIAYFYGKIDKPPRWFQKMPF